MGIVCHPLGVNYRSIDVCPLQFVSSNYVRLKTSTYFSHENKGLQTRMKRKKIVSYKGPRDGKPSPGNPRGKVSFPLRVPPEGEKHGVGMENSLTEIIDKGAECVSKIKPHTTTMRRS